LPVPFNLRDYTCSPKQNERENANLTRDQHGVNRQHDQIPKEVNLMAVIEIKHYKEKTNGSKPHKIVKIPVQNSTKEITIDEKDYDELERLGAFPPYIHMQDNIYVRMGKPDPKRPYQSRLVSLARLILDSDQGHRVSYLDNDCFNLRRSNLIKIAGSAKYSARAMLMPFHKRNKPQINHIHYN
jgi:hypothetical protein